MNVTFEETAPRAKVPIDFGPFHEKGMQPLGLKSVLDTANLNVAGMWMTSVTLFRYGVIAPRTTVPQKTIELRIDTIDQRYPMVAGGKMLGVAVHETAKGGERGAQGETTMRGLHVIGDDDCIARLWADMWEGAAGIRGFDMTYRSMCWTALAPSTVFVPYIDIDEKGTDEHDLTRVLEERVCPTIEIIERGMTGPKDRQIFFNFRKTEDGLMKFSFHVHWWTSGIANIHSWKAFLSTLHELPRKLAWKQSAEKWTVQAEEQKPIVDLAVYGGKRQLFRGPFCGKHSATNTVLQPVIIKKAAAAEGGTLRCFPDHSASTSEFIMRARIARSQKGLHMINNLGSTHPTSLAPTNSPSQPLESAENAATTHALLNFLTPLLQHDVLPAWQKFREKSLRDSKHARGAVVPTTNLKIIKNESNKKKQGVRHIQIEGDTFCEMDPSHCHTKSKNAIGIVVDLIKCTIKQSCFACGTHGQLYCFLHIGNRIEIKLEKISQFTAIEHFALASNPHQFLLDYYPDRFRLNRMTQLVWVFETETCTWKNETNANIVVGKLIDSMNFAYAAYIQAKKAVIFEREIASFSRKHPHAEQLEAEEFTLKAVERARKFVKDHLMILKIGATARAKMITELKNYAVHREVEDFNPFTHLVPMKNRMSFNVFTGETIECHAEQYHTSLLNAETIPLAHPDIKDINEWFMEIASGDVDKCTYLKRLAGYMLTFLTHDRKFYVLKGIGKNGKGLYKAFLCSILDGPTGSDPRWKSLKPSFWHSVGNQNENPEACSPEAYELMHKCIYYTDDMDRGQLDSCKVKRYAGAEAVSSRTAYGRPIRMTPRGKILWTTNFFPDGPGSDNAYWERFSVIPMNTKYIVGGPAKPDMYRFLQNDQKYRELLSKKDAFFTVVMTTLNSYYASLPFNDATREPDMLVPFPVPDSVRQCCEEARDNQLPLAAFMRKYTDEAAFPTDWVTIETLFSNYIQFLDNLNEKRLKNETTQTGFVRLLTSALDIECTAQHVTKKRLVKEVPHKHNTEQQPARYSGDAHIAPTAQRERSRDPQLSGDALFSHWNQ